MNDELQLNDAQLSKLITAVLTAENRLKSTSRDMTLREIYSEFSGIVGGIKVDFLSRGDGAAIRTLTGSAVGADRKSARRNISALSKLLAKEQKRRSRKK